MYENKIYYVSTVKYTIQKKRPTVNTLKGACDVGHWKKLCRAQNVPGLVFALIASLAGFYSRGSWHWLWCPCCVGPILVSVLAFVVVLALASVLTHSAGVHHAGIRVGIRCAGVRVGVRRAGVCAGVRRAGVCAGVRRAGVRAGVSCCHVGARLAVVRAFEQAPVLLSCGRSSRRTSCCCAGIHVGICLAVVLAFVQASVVPIMCMS